MWKTISMQAGRRNWRPLVGGVFLPLVFMTGCAGMSNTDKGALAGTGIGAGIGAVVGKACGNTGAGAVIGGVLGLATGATIGNDIDRHEEHQAVQQAVAQQAAQQAEAQKRWPTLEEIQKMAANGINDANIINQIRTTGAIYHLTSDQVVWLKQYGVSDAVIAEMQATATRVPPPVVYQPVRERVIIYDDPPPVRVGFGYYRRW
jgi:uncharacterized protein YcfJ